MECWQSNLFEFVDTYINTDKLRRRRAWECALVHVRVVLACVSASACGPMHLEADEVCSAATLVVMSAEHLAIMGNIGQQTLGMTSRCLWQGEKFQCC